MNPVQQLYIPRPSLTSVFDHWETGKVWEKGCMQNLHEVNGTCSQACAGEVALLLMQHATAKVQGRRNGESPQIIEVVDQI